MSGAGTADVTLPWGHWMRQDTDGMFVDGDGRRWRSLLDALWRGRLRMAGDGGGERLLAFLLSCARRPGWNHEDARDIFDGCQAFADFHRSWCEGHGLIDGYGLLTTDGHGVLALLTLTRDWELGPVPIGEHDVAVEPDPAAPRHERERMFDDADAFGRDAPFRFERDVVAGRPVVTFSGRHDFSGMPLGAVVWTQDFPDEESRDAFFQWLCVRVDRWGEWGRRGAHLGGGNLGAHLLSLCGADMSRAGRQRPAR